MKIRLYMFGYPCGPIRDIPSNSGHVFKTALKRDPYVVFGELDRPVMYTECEFEWTGEYEGKMESMPEEFWVKVYRLKDVIKR